MVKVFQGAVREREGEELSTFAEHLLRPVTHLFLTGTLGGEGYCPRFTGEEVAQNLP